MQVIPKMSDESQILKVQSHLRNHVMVLLTNPTAPNVSMAKAIIKQINALDKARAKL
jgi:hypothetical protein